MTPNTRNTPTLISRSQDRLRRIVRGRGIGAFLLATGLVVAVAAGWTAFYTERSDSVAVVQRFGRYLRDVPPGLHTTATSGGLALDTGCEPTSSARSDHGRREPFRKLDDRRRGGFMDNPIHTDGLGSPE